MRGMSVYDVLAICHLSDLGSILSKTSGEAERASVFALYTIKIST